MESLKILLKDTVMTLKEKIESFIVDEGYNKKTDMCKLLDNGSDKSSWHNYTTLYDILFSDLLERILIF